MSGYSALHVSDPAGTALARFGLAPTDPQLGDIVPTAARGNNLVVVAPPAAIHAIPGLVGAISAYARQSTGVLLVLVPEPALAEWEAVVTSVGRSTGHTVHAARTLARASRLLQSGSVHILVAAPETALALTERSVLKADRVAGIFLAWPELWESETALAPLMQDIGHDVPRVIYTAEPGRVAGLVERYARRAHTAGPATSEMAGEASPPAGSKPGTVRLVSVGWQQRQHALQDTLELLDPATCAVWTLSPDPDFVPALPPGTQLAVRQVPAPGLTIAYDIPAAAQLAQLTAVGDVVLLVPPTALAWVRRVVPEARVLRLAGASDATARAVQARRQRVAGMIDGGSGERGLLALAPLFERHDPALIAAVLYELWQEQPGAPAAPAPATPTGADVMSAATARIWVGVGKKDSATPNDFVGVLTKELGYERGKIGKIEVRELYSLVEVPAVEAEEVAGRLNGVTIRRRRVTARIDRGGKVRSER